MRRLDSGMHAWRRSEWFLLHVAESALFVSAEYGRNASMAFVLVRAAKRVQVLERMSTMVSEVVMLVAETEGTAKALEPSSRQNGLLGSGEGEIRPVHVISASTESLLWQTVVRHACGDLVESGTRRQSE